MARTVGVGQADRILGPQHHASRNKASRLDNTRPTRITGQTTWERFRMRANGTHSMTPDVANGAKPKGGLTEDGNNKGDSNTQRSTLVGRG